MKIKRHKHVRRILRFYKINFNIQSPYKVLIDGTFAHEALKSKINLVEQITKYFESKSEGIKILTTKCALNELKLLGSATYGALHILEQYPLVPCKHENREFINTEKCFKKLVGSDNLDQYIVATSSETLKEHVRALSATPLLILSHRALNLEKPSDSSMKKADNKLKEKLEPKLTPPVIGKTPGNIVIHKRRKAKGPNPLSCKKSIKTKNKFKAKLNELRVLHDKHFKNK
jgi:U3 small nucleolar RNA-associated protein 23